MVHDLFVTLWNVLSSPTPARRTSRRLRPQLAFAGLEDRLALSTAGLTLTSDPALATDLTSASYSASYTSGAGLTTTPSNPDDSTDSSSGAPSSGASDTLVDQPSQPPASTDLVDTALGDFPTSSDPVLVATA